MLESNLIILRSGIVLVFGLGVSVLFSGVKPTRSGKLAMIVFFAFVLSIQILCWKILGLETTKELYPFITHSPTILFLAIHFKQPWLISISGVLTAYLCCQVPRWFGSLAWALTGSFLADHMTYFITMCFVYYFLKKYVAESVVQLIERSTRSCLLFGAVPLLYYLFDYFTTIYTDLLYTGARQVNLHTNVNLPEKLNVNDTELCALLSNALENAIAAASQIEDEKLRKVYIHAIINGDKLVISTENAYAGVIVMDGDLPKSEQSDPGHGYGIKSMISIVERHGGLYSMETEGGVFILQLLLPLGKEATSA